MGECLKTEWELFLEDAIDWLPLPIREDIKSRPLVSDWVDPVESLGFLKAVMAIKEARLEDALEAIEALYQTSKYPGSLFLLKARVHFLLGEFESLASCLRVATDLDEDREQAINTSAELHTLLKKIIQSPATHQQEKNVDDLLASNCTEQPSGKEHHFEVTADFSRVPNLNEGVDAASTDFDLDETQLTGIDTVASRYPASYTMLSRGAQSNHKLKIDNIYIPKHYRVSQIIEPIARSLEVFWPLQSNRITESSLCFGLHVLADEVLARLPDNLFVFNLEQLASSREGYLNFLKRSRVFDYSVRNITTLSTKTGLCRLLPQPICQSEQFMMGKSAETDILFVGSINERRREVLDTLSSMGYRVRVETDLGGSALHDALSTSKIILNIHFYESKILEVFRLALTRGTDAIWLSELVYADSIRGYEFLYDPDFFWSDYSQLFERLELLLSDDQHYLAVKQKQETAFERWKTIYQADLRINFDLELNHQLNIKVNYYKPHCIDYLQRIDAGKYFLLSEEKDLSDQGWLEAQLFYHESIRSVVDQGDYFGNLSWKVFHKMGANPCLLASTIRKELADGPKVLLLNPSPFLASYFVDGFEQASACGHSGLQDFFESRFPEKSCKNHLPHSSYFSPASYIIANTEGWTLINSLLASEVFLPMAGDKTEEDFNFLKSPGHYIRNKNLTMRPFFVERYLQYVYITLSKSIQIKVVYPSDEHLRERYGELYDKFERIVKARAHAETERMSKADWMKYRVEIVSNKDWYELATSDDRPMDF